MYKGRLQDHLDKIKKYKAVVEIGSISKAAANLCQSQSSLSHCVMVLEEVVGDRLFERSRRGIRMTRKGELLYEFSKRLELEVKNLQVQMETPKIEMAGRLRLGTHETLAVHVWPKFLHSFIEKFPHILLTLNSGRVDPIVEAVLNRDCDLAVTVAPITDTRLEKIELYQGCFGFYKTKGNKPLYSKLSKKNLNLKDLEDIPILTDTFAHIKQGMPLPKYLRGVGLNLVDAYEVNSFDSAIRLASEGLGIAVIPERNAREALKQGLVEPVKLKGIDPESFGSYNIVAYYRKDTDSVGLIKILIEELQKFFCD